MLSRVIPGFQNGAVIFASPDFTSWLQDKEFMASFLKRLYSPQKLDEKDDLFTLDVISGVADGLSPSKLLGKPESGFSVLYGSQVSLPDIFETDTVASRGPDLASSISLVLKSDKKAEPRHEITMPLANTVFQNGQRSTLFATRWFWHSGLRKSPVLSKIVEKQHQRILAKLEMAQATYIPLLPLTPPRKIVAGLGNIVTKVNVQGVVTTASQELEHLIPQLLDIRSKSDAAWTPGPIGVWAWVIPARVLESEKNLLFNLRVFQDHASEPEEKLTQEATRGYRKLLSLGCRLHKILSGGGGWGAKAGLLSLDSETDYLAPEQESIDDFIKAFEERGYPDHEQSGGVVTPGSYIWFCAEPARKTLDTGVIQAKNEDLKSTFTFGVAPSGEVEQGEDKPPVHISGRKFGAISAVGVYLKSGQVGTKIDVPGALVMNGVE
ncbi:uncharacterized protein BCR38DRAFT_339204 [Pseudomassariella vexata]|uniref:Uncharacterized protein n=1 Tax=Pseudomassariella vexata TaxID=1141098 RepID=A0A1Y2E444_9PEZI|nr:uncharacterized protein BCR38DRAFT_339204 [Pseudomassariella vexata]ORY66321.1 hypothetical protein BCR38DRAFT_339204 [Pseudomassariella vexata]